MAENNTYYITTPIYYPSGKLHIGNSYTTIACDAEARFQRLEGKDVFFLTGTDEHGLKIEQKAEALNTTPKAYVDGMAEDIKKLWDLLEITNDKFIRTTDDYHEKAVQKIFQKLLDQGDIYLGEYEGWYSVSDEEYFTESQLAEVYRDADGNVTGGKAPSGNEVELVKEESYFFKMSKYADWLLDYYQTHPNFIQPASRMNEMINNFIKPGLEDLAVTRTGFKWGVPIKNDPKHVIYVWIDALSNYITALGYSSDEDGNFKKFWPANVHMVGKEIVRFHTIYWPIMLHALGLEQPDQIYGHGWLLMKDSKMSKSKGNVIYPETIVKNYGLDALRYYLLKAMPYGNDGNFTPEDFISKINFDLANDLGNLLNRTVAMINKYEGGVIPTFQSGVNDVDVDLETTAATTIKNYEDLMNNLHFADALAEIWKLVARTNKYIDETTPWILARNDDDESKQKLASVMNHLAESLRVIAILIQPMMTQSPAKIFAQLGLDVNQLELQGLKFGEIPADTKVVEKGTPIFPRLDVEKEVEFLKNQMTQSDKKKGRAAMAEANQKKAEAVATDQKKEIRIEAFDKVELRVAEVLEAGPVKGADKLLKFKLDAGDEEPRQILSGIAQSYPDPSVLVGKKVVIVANLKPRKMRGEMSQGMILSTEHDDQVKVVMVDDQHQNGDVLG
ncbi:methionine--tRNA ligase [Pediococcus pentosaceus]|jgi:methionyl-tRNA synthetase|uniref:Methionine--tRNA ligase n=2 Tax=Pediococcus pentosaceus TaxID=1255 RepID=A0ABQ6XG74_PEDPE|nr:MULTISPECIES: methionine--tRNA ligase [Pediococcus]ABJ67363.1 methionyl-tRNA synthetase [Pediococcus pentosaceus ATCC 25745]KAF0351245.1 methionine--tRNA ligase [Pediococcus pentosaceus]KAF0413350.1 methionine--tRNA ligase [Pediococcus pentosaceus]KAF0423436.1 methionine--tRNA ligase [Pediococcus pentosaceus]KAF0503665.1 methionine--tRNA ligase [Pediococcus pentosaceus]